MPKIRLNENEEVVRTIREGLAAKGGYCPCRVEIKEEYKCMCQEFRDQIADPNFEGYCHCMLYYKERDRQSTVNPGDSIHGFKVTAVRYVDEIKADFIEMVHEKTGAQLVWTDNKAENKLFCIGFKTLPEDSTGVFHILEHSVLAGSEKYPVKEPFVDLLRSSMNTFLNAITFTDKTCYPVSSRNRQDFLNLTGVYLDAVFAPRLLTDPNIFYQEGWHISEEEGKYAYNGVVFNEMKGAMSGADDVVAQRLQEMVFPDNCYGWNSGGEPSVIPDLSYEQFCETYKRYYHPSNSRIFLDGDIPLDDTLSLIDSYLSRFEKADGFPNFVPQEPRVIFDENEFSVAADEDCTDKTWVSLGKIVGKWDEGVKLAALKILLSTVAGTNETPLKKAMLDSGLVQEVEIDLDDSMLQPYTTVIFKNVKDGAEKEVVELFRRKASEIAEKGIDREDLRASVNVAEFQAKDKREPQGLMRCFESFKSWLYGGDPLMYVEHDKLFAELRKLIEEGYCERLLKEIYASEENTVLLISRPSKEIAEIRQKDEDRRVSELTSVWTDEQKEANRVLNEKLVLWQSTPDSPEQTATIPVLKLSDVDDKPVQVDTEVTEASGVKILFHKLNCNGIINEKAYFKLTDLDADTLVKFASATGLLMNLPTRKHSVIELQRAVKNTIGRFRFSVSAYKTDSEDDVCVPVLEVGFASLAENVQEAEKLVAEILTETDFSDINAIRNLVIQKYEASKQYPITAGNQLAMNVALSHSSSQAAVSEMVSGVSQLRWTRELATEFDSRIDDYTALVSHVLNDVVCKAKLTMSVTTDEQYVPESFLSALKEGTNAAEYAAYKSKLPERTAIVIPAPVGYSSQAFQVDSIGEKYSGSFRAGSQMSSFSYLWNEVRVKGGAYGTRMYVNNRGMIETYSYRDPSPVKSIELNKGIGSFIREFCASGKPTDNFIISAVAAMEPLVSPSVLGEQADAEYFAGITYEKKVEERRQLLGTTVSDFERFADIVDRFADKAPVCIVAGEALLADAKDLETITI